MSLRPPDAAAYATSGHLSVATSEFAAVRFAPTATCADVSRCFAPAGVRADAPAAAIVRGSTYRGIATTCNIAATGDAQVFCEASHVVCTGADVATGAPLPGCEAHGDMNSADANARRSVTTAARHSGVCYTDKINRGLASLGGRGGAPTLQRMSPHDHASTWDCAVAQTPCFPLQTFCVCPPCMLSVHGWSRGERRGYAAGTAGRGHRQRRVTALCTRHSCRPLLRPHSSACQGVSGCAAGARGRGY